MRISYRMGADEDIDAMAAFWSSNSGWDIIDRAEWEKRFVNTPFGKAEVVIGLDDATDKIVGQFVFIPVSIVINGRETKTYRPFAPILQQSLQTKFGIASLLTGQHPLLKMYKLIWEELATRGVPLIYIIPDPRWSRVLQAFPFIHTHRFPLWSKSLKSISGFLTPAGITVSKINPSDPTIDLLWRQSSEVYACSIVRNSKSLSWKTSHGDYHVYAVRREEQIIGVFVFIYKQKDNQWLICDMIVKDKTENLLTTLTAACYIIQKKAIENNNGNEPMGKIAILATPAIENAVTKLEFQKDNYHFTLAVHVLNNEMTDSKNIAPINWYISAND